MNMLKMLQKHKLCHDFECKLDTDQNDFTISTFKIKGGIEDLATPSVSRPAGVPTGKKTHTQHIVVRRVDSHWIRHCGEKRRFSHFF